MKTKTTFYKTCLLIIGLLTISSNAKSQPLTGDKTVGAGGIYATLSDAITALNTNGVGTGGVTFLLTDAFYFETQPLTITAIGNSSNLITFKPSTGVSPKITLTPVYSITQDSVYGIKLSGTKYIVFDGSSNGSATRDMTFELTQDGNVFWIGDDADNNTIKNCNIKSFSSDSIFSIGIRVRGAGCDSTLIQNNKIYNAYRGIYIYAPNSSGFSTGTKIIDNLVGDILNPITTSGIDCAYSDNLEIRGNEVGYIIRNRKGNNPIGISVTTSPNQILKIEKNKIHDIYSNCYEGRGGRGIDVFVYANNPMVSIRNNMIWNIGSGTSHSVGSTLENYIPMGIHMFRSSTFTGGVFNLQHNSIYITPDNIHGLNPDMKRVIGVWIGIGFTGKVDFRNNIVQINLGENLATVSSEAYGIYCESVTADPFIPGSLNGNMYQITGQDLNYIAKFKGLAQLFSGWQTATIQEANSLNQDPMFISVSDLHIQNGQHINGINLNVSDDIDGNIRSIPPDIGADEFDITISLSAYEKENNILVFPNPATEIIKITGIPQNSKLLTLFDISGNVIFSRVIDKNNSMEIGCNTVSKGIYMLNITTESGKITKKLIVN